MAFDVELFWFSVGPVDYRHCSNDKPYVHQLQTYYPLPIESDKRKVSVRIEDTRKKIEVPRDSDVAKRWLRTPLPTEMRLVIYRVVSGSETHRVSFNGFVLGGRQQGEKVVLTCQSVIASLNVTGLGLRFGRGCSNVLYGDRCGINRGDHLVVGTVTGISGLNVTVSGLSSPDGKYDGGYVEWLSVIDGAQQTLSISNQVGSILTLVSVPSTLAVGFSLSMYRGCDQTLEICVNDFNNSDNYLGAPYRPDKNPGGGTTLF